MGNLGSELVLSAWWLLIIHASCEKKIDQKHPGETNPCCLCDQLRHKLNTRHELKEILLRKTAQTHHKPSNVAGKGCQGEEQHDVL